MATNEMAQEDVKAHNGLNIDRTMIKEFWPAGVIDNLSKPIVSMHEEKKHVVLGS